MSKRKKSKFEMVMAFIKAITDLVRAAAPWVPLVIAALKLAG